MSPIPHTFVQLHKIAGLTETEIAERWGDLNQKTATDLLVSLAKDNTLTDEQLKKVSEILKRLKETSTQADVISLLAFVLTRDQIEAVANKYVELLTQNLNQTYQTLTDKSSMEQKQVMQSYLEVAKNG